jgi:integrase
MVLGAGARARGLVPTFGRLPLKEINEPAVRRWRKERLDAGVGESIVAKGYRLVRESVTVLRDYTRITGAPKSKAGVRTVHLPESVVRELRHHLCLYAHQDPDGHVFVGAKGTPLARPTFSRPWRKALAKAELKNIQVHDLRHTGNTLASTTGTSLRELMARMGHSTPRAALICQHASTPARQQGP